MTGGGRVLVIRRALKVVCRPTVLCSPTVLHGLVVLHGSAVLRGISVGHNPTQNVWVKAIVRNPGICDVGKATVMGVREVTDLGLGVLPRRVDG